CATTWPDCSGIFCYLSKGLEFW
nr:immunoglobulin heavy chain junction region [Macaca mulatta]MOX91488.1 immunoglobulin heavy chain junction region [Macaca mulatta]MOX91638.1 immunoglobulin heavy chain junction region [Macaca mulatta]MOX92007.1 immunoglobulin heavy chain junction region [Macaca mulatta]MOX92065.1 immunoglobulin heavy chain junction region [Macaca mulatta]